MKMGLQFDPDQQQGRLVRRGMEPSVAHVVGSVLGLQLAALMVAVLVNLLVGVGLLFLFIPLALAGLVLAFGGGARGSWMFNEPLPKFVPGVIDFLPHPPLVEDFHIRGGVLQIGNPSSAAKLEGATIIREPDTVVIRDDMGREVVLQVDAVDGEQLDSLEQWLRALSKKSFGSEADVPTELRTRRAQPTEGWERWRVLRPPSWTGIGRLDRR